MKKAFSIAGILALSIIPTPSFSGEVEQKEIMSVTEQLLPQIGEKYKNLDIKEKKAYKQSLIEYLDNVQKKGVTGVSDGFIFDLGACIPKMVDKDMDKYLWCRCQGKGLVLWFRSKQRMKMIIQTNIKMIRLVLAPLIVIY